MTTTVRATSPADLAVLVPYQLGYHPGPSVMLIALHEKRLGMMQRHDLLEQSRPCAEAARRALQVVAREEATAVILLAHEDDEGDSAPLREAMVAAAEEAGIVVREQVLVRDGRWFAPEGHRTDCPEQGVPLPPPADVPGVAAYVRAGVAPFESRQALVADVVRARDETRARQVGLYLAALGRAPGTRTFGGGPTRDRLTWELDPVGTIRAWQLVLDPRPEAIDVAAMSDLDLARVTASLQDAGLRDAVMAVLCPGTLPLVSLDPLLVEDARVAAARCAWTHDGDGFPDADDRWGVDEEDASGEELADHDHEDLLLVRRRLVDLARLVPQGATPDLFALIGHLAWFAGDGTVTGVCLEQALETDPDHRLAGLMLQLLSAGVRPWTPPAAA